MKTPNIYFLIISILFFFQPVYSQSFQERKNNKIVIDTDCGIDDFRALALILELYDTEIAGIIISDGNIPPEKGIEKLSGLLKKTGRDHIPVGKGKTLNSIVPVWREFNSFFVWGEDAPLRDNHRSSIDLLREIINENNEKTTILCMGPLTNLSDLIQKNPELITFIDRVIWYNSDIKTGEGFNYLYDTVSVKNVIDSGLRMDIISNLGKPEAFFEWDWILQQNNYSTTPCRLLTDFYSENHIPENHFNKQLILRDELLVLYFSNPELFNMITLPGNRNVRLNKDYDLPAIQEAIHDMIAGKYSIEKHIVFNSFPSSREMLNYDVRQIMDSALVKHGAEEWERCVLANEFHGHLGIYSIIGVKMGIRAREFFNIGTDVLRVVSYAGNNPPYSCLNDGLQVSTGATLGMGLISVSEQIFPVVTADFTYKDKTVRLTLKKEYMAQIENDISEGIVKFGLSDDGYWRLIRQSALRYWLEWGRNEIFEIE